MTTGDRIRAMRRHACLTQEQAAARIGITQSRWSAIEHPDTNHTVATLEKVAAALGCCVKDLV